jgi:hypothetical protein
MLVKYWIESTCGDGRSPGLIVWQHGKIFGGAAAGEARWQFKVTTASSSLAV